MKLPKDLQVFSQANKLAPHLSVVPNGKSNNCEVCDSKQTSLQYYDCSTSMMWIAWFILVQNFKR